MKKLLLFLFLVFAATSYAQQAAPVGVTVKGVLLDSLTQEGEPYATLRIVKKSAPAKALKMAVTDTKGRFQEKTNLSAGTYLLTLTSIGKTTVTKEFTLKADERTIDLGTLYTVEATNELKGVEIVAQKPLVKADIDKIEYSVQDDPDAQTNSTLEMLRKVPLVTVDGEDNIKVNGSSSFKIHVNGKENTMMSNNPVDVLKSLPANSLKRIEVITNPGAKYDAEGIGGILNIVTLGSGFEGYMASFTAGVNNTGGNGSLYTTIKKNKLTLSARYAMYLRSSPRSFSGGLQENITAGTEILSDNSSKSKGKYQNGSLEASYEIDTLQLISLGIGLYGGNNDGRNNGFTRMYSTSAPESTLYSYQNNGFNNGSWYSISGNLDYQRTSRKNKERIFTLSYKVNTSPSTSDSEYFYSDLAYATPEWKEYLDKVLLNQHSDGKENSAEHTFQADYTTPIAKIHTLETGVKYIIRNNHSDNNRYDAQGNYDDYRSSHYKHLNDILAAYLGYNLKIKKFSGRAGLRYERTMQSVEYANKHEQDFDINFNDLIPSASLGLKINDTSNLRAGYNMRISRPGIWYLNPYLNDSNPSYISRGNPDLVSEKAHSFDLSYSNFTQKLYFNASLRYEFNNNGIDNVTALVDDRTIPGLKEPTGKEVLYSTYQNIGKSQRASGSFYVRWSITAKTSIYANCSADYAYLKSPAQNLENRGWNSYIYGGIEQTFPFDIRATLNGMYQTPYVSLQGKGSSYYDYGLNFNKSFLKEKRLTVSVYLNNLFEKYRGQHYTTEGDGFRSSSHSSYPCRRFGFSVSYRIGELKASVKKASRSISNDDVKSGGGGGQ